MTTPSFTRDDNGLVKGMPHVFDELGRVNWQKMLLPKHLYVNPDYQEQVMVRQNVKSKWDIDVTKCEDKELLVTLAGLKYLARLRGVEAVRVHDLHVSPTEVTSVCSIQFAPNYENPDGLTVEAQASASLYSVSGKFQLYLAAFAQNRAFTRAAKDGLGIEILGFEEVDFKASKAFEEALKSGDNPLVAASKPTTPIDDEFKVSGFDANAFLARRCAELNKNGSHSFDKIKEHALTITADLKSDPNTWTGFADIDRLDACTLLEKINKKGKKIK